jgi:hypothetical protein
MDKLRLDGNAAAGTLGEVFSFEVTTAEYTCEGCGKIDQIGTAMVYEVRGLGTIVRCPSCDNALIGSIRCFLHPIGSLYNREKLNSITLLERAPHGTS